MSERKFIQKINASNYKFIIAVTGGGTAAIGELLKYGGGSSTLIEAIVPYSPQSLQNFIGTKPEKYVSSKTARLMAMASFQKAIKLNHVKNIFGIGVTCSLKKKDERLNRKHEIYIAVQTSQYTSVYNLLLTIDRKRQLEEKIVSELILRIIGHVCLQQDCFKNMNLLTTDEKITVINASSLPNMEKLLLQDNHIFYSVLSKFNKNNIQQSNIIFSGSFDPCHKNHVQMATIASNKFNMQVIFEISIKNVDKPPIDYISLEERINSIKNNINEVVLKDIVITNAPLFAQKAELFPNSIFIVGTDTVQRIFNVKYYRNADNQKSLFEHFIAHKIKFLVFQRKDKELIIPDEVKSIFITVPINEYQDDGMSSTSMRQLLKNEK